MRARSLLWIGLLSLPSQAALAVANPAQIIFPDRERSQLMLGQQGPEHPFLAPGNVFSVRLPKEWKTKTFPKRPDFVEVRVDNSSSSAQLQIKRHTVAEGAHPRQLLLRALELRLKKLPHFEETGRRDLKVNGLAGVAITGTFWYQGNAEYPRALEEVFLVVGTDAFELHFECFAPAFEELSDPLGKIYQTFVARPPAQAPAAPEDKDDLEDPMEDLPF